MRDLYRRISLTVLCLTLLVAMGLLGAPRELAGAAGVWPAVLQLTVIAIAAWISGLDLLFTGPEAERATVLGAAFLILPVALFALWFGYGPPEFADHAQNTLRYLTLIIDTASIAIGFVLVQDRLGEAGERIFSKLSVAIILIATPLYLVWAALLLEAHRAALAELPWAGGPWTQWLMAMSDILLFFAGLATYLAGASLTIAFARVGWIGPRTAWTLVGVTLIAFVGLVLRGIEFPDPAIVFAEGYSIPGWIAGIPAVPWLIPCILGLILIRRAAVMSTRLAPSSM